MRRAQIERLQVELGENVSLRELGARVAKAHTEGRSFSGTQILQYQNGEIDKVGIDFVWAYAKATGADAGWLAFGDEHAPEVPRATMAAPIPGVPGAKIKRSSKPVRRAG